MPIASSAATSATPRSAASCASPAVRLKIEPNSVRAAIVPLAPEAPELKRSRNSTPSPRTHTNTIPVVTSSARARRAEDRAEESRAPSSSATPTVAANSPTRRSRPAAAAASAPVNATWLSASPANDLHAQHHEVADQPARHRDARAREQGVAEEPLEHQRSALRASRAAANSASAMLVTKKPGGSLVK